MATTARLRAKGQVTIPAPIRKDAGLREGSVVEFLVVDEGVLVRPLLVADPDTTIDDAFARDVILRTIEGYAALREDPDAWAAELRERELWESTLPDGVTD